MGGGTIYKALAKIEKKHPTVVIPSSNAEAVSRSANHAPGKTAKLEVSYAPVVHSAGKAKAARTTPRPWSPSRRAEAEGADASSKLPTRLKHSMSDYLSQCATPEARPGPARPAEDDANRRRPSGDAHRHGRPPPSASAGANPLDRRRSARFRSEARYPAACRPAGVGMVGGAEEETDGGLFALPAEDHQAVLPRTSTRSSTRGSPSSRPSFTWPRGRSATGSGARSSRPCENSSSPSRGSPTSWRSATRPSWSASSRNSPAVPERLPVRRSVRQVHYVHAGLLSVGGDHCLAA